MRSAMLSAKKRSAAIFSMIDMRFKSTRRLIAS